MISRKVTEEFGPAVEAYGGVPLGSHMSVADGVGKAFARGEENDCAVMQIFVKNNNRWRGTPLSNGAVEEFWAERQRTGIWPVFAHNTYLVNLASGDRVIRERSVACTVDELRRCQRLGLPWLVIHPGSHGGAGVEVGINRFASAIGRVLDKTPEVETKVLLETTAGQGAGLGRSAEEISWMLDAVDAPERTGVCLDTCHIFAAGYELRDKISYDDTIKAFDTTIGLDRIKAIHLNDSKKPFGSFRDRHEHIGDGEIGEDGFRFVMTDPRLHLIPKILETPKTEGADRRNLALLRRFAAEAR
jgi:deoxyribonuclease-4